MGMRPFSQRGSPLLLRGVPSVEGEKPPPLGKDRSDPSDPAADVFSSLGESP